MRIKHFSISMLVVVNLFLGNTVGFAGTFDDAKTIHQITTDNWVGGLNQKDMDVFMAAWVDAPEIQLIDVNPVDGQLRISAGDKEVRNVIAAFAQQREINEFQVTHLTIQTDGNQASVFLKWEWGEWVDNLKTGKGNWGTTRLVREKGEWKIHDVDFYSLVLKQLDLQTQEDISDLMIKVAESYQQKDLLPLIPLIADDHLYVDPAGTAHHGAAATQVALAQSIPDVDLNAEVMVTYIDVANRVARVSQAQADGSAIWFVWKSIDGEWKLAETNLAGKVIEEPKAVQPRAKRLTTWGNLKQRK